MGILLNLELTIAEAAGVRHFSDMMENTEVNIGFASLSALLETFGQLVDLRWLRLHNNKLTALPESFGQLVALQDLHLGNNKLTTLPESFGRLVALQRLHLHTNKLAAL